MYADELATHVKDPARLAALRAVALLDTPTEQAFDRLSRLAARFLNAPVALVTLVDADRQFFKSCIGLPEPWQSRRQTPLSHSFCQHNRIVGKPLLIDDARTHPIFKDNLAIRDLKVIAYLGIPLATSDGYVLGSFCVIDSKPRRWLQEDVAVMNDLAAAVMTEIQLRTEIAARNRAEGERDTYAELNTRLRTEIAGRKRAEESLQASARFNRRIAEIMPSILYILDLSTKKNIYLNREISGFLGHTPELVQAMGEEFLPQLMHPEDQTRFRQHLHQLAGLSQGAIAAIEYRMRAADGSWRWMLSRNTIFERDAAGQPLQVLGTATDISERKMAEEKLRATLQEKELLLQEIYHRTKNNMQVISAILELQAASLGNREVDQLIRDSTRRIHTMALAHEKLYKARSLSWIDLKEYVQDLAQLLAADCGISPQQIRLAFDLEEVNVLIDIAVPCGLIINELLANSFQHAFPHGRAGRIELGLHRMDADQLELTVSDDGVGLPAGFDILRSPTLGVRLVCQIARHQLRGSVSAEADHGLCWRIRFSAQLYHERV